MKLSELIAALENIGDVDGDVDVYITNLGTGVSGEVCSVENNLDRIELVARHMDVVLDEES